MTKELRFKAAKMPAKILTKVKIKGKAKVIIEELRRQLIIHNDYLDCNDDWSHLYAIKVAAELLGHKGIVRNLEALFKVMEVEESGVVDD
jgi:hypothetical protein